MVTDIKQIAVSFFDESDLGDNLHAGTLELPAELTVLEMLLRRVEFDCRTFAAGLDEPFRGLVQPLEVKEVDDEVVLSTPSSPDSTLLLDVAVRAFGDGSLEIYQGEQQLMHVTDIVRNSGEVPITFVKRSPLLAQ